MPVNVNIGKKVRLCYKISQITVDVMIPGQQVDWLQSWGFCILWVLSGDSENVTSFKKIQKGASARERDSWTDKLQKGSSVVISD